jgi:KaiC/GvpD/RAD55 family RecA-like ATPase
MLDVNVIRFGIPSVDELFGDPHHGHDDSQPGKPGIHLPQRKSAAGVFATSPPDSPEAMPPSSVSLCITGPGGTGKSILAMHLASRYLADCWDAGDLAAKVFYVSTDLKYEVASSVWQRFGLARPNHRIVPFDDRLLLRAKTGRPVSLVPCHPLQSPEEEEGVAPLSHYLVSAETSEPKVYFVDLASNTAGDDWGFVSRVLSVLERDERSLPHLLIIDSVEGFETLVGERDAFGESQPRRSRVAQILRSAGNKCHIVFIVEEPKEGEHLPEEFVTDAVVRLRSNVFRDYGRRTIEIVKSRGQAHVRGQHILLIRSGAGSTTGNRFNHDDPKVSQLPAPALQSYVQVCPSLHYLNRRIMSLRGQGLPPNEPAKYAAFGIRYLDDMLASKIDDFKRGGKGDDQRGLLCRTTTALIGNSQTQKSPLGHAFLSRCFRSYAEEFAKVISVLSQNPAKVQQIWDDAANLSSGNQEVNAGEEWRRNIFSRLSDMKNIGNIVKAAALSLGPPQEERDGVPVLLTTHDLHTESLVGKFLPWLLRKVPALATMDLADENFGCVAALRVLMEERTICRRLEIHDMPSAVLIHIVQRSIETAQRFLFQGDLPGRSEERFKRSPGIRVVIDDMSILRDTYVDIRDDPLLLRCLVFLLGREGVTTLLIDTQEGHPHLTVPSHLDSELRTLVAGHIYTWRFSFYDSDRVAIAAMPSMRPQARTVIRELREGTGQGTGPEAATLVVDPHFELYSGIETGQPKPIPLMIRLYEEMPAFKLYIAEQNKRCIDLFTPTHGTGGQIVFGEPVAEYQRLAQIASTQRETLLDHALVFQVDEFLAMRRPGIRRSGTARPAWDYLHAKTFVENSSSQGTKPERIWAVDPFAWFQKTLLDQEGSPPTSSALSGEEPAAHADDSERHGEDAYRRADTFVTHGYTLMDSKAKDLIDRVPFMWDFGFLLCRIHVWEDEHNRTTELEFLKKGSNPEAKKFPNVAEVWKQMPLGTKDGARGAVERPSWRVFLEACYQLAKAQTYSTSRLTQAFDLHASAPPGLSCLILEIWASEILKNANEDDREEFIELVARREWKGTQKGLIDLLASYTPELFRTWLLLVEVLDLESLAVAITEGRLGTRSPNPACIAVRHWYKTAWAFTQDLSVEDPVVPVGLPGHFSVRGDWFLAVAGGSRSERLADQALDFLNTRSANYERLRCGLGLPVRRIVTDHLRTGIITLDRGDIPAPDHLRTGSITLDRGDIPAPGKQRRRVSRVHYENLIRLGGPVEGLTDLSDPAIRESFEPTDFHWFWRSRLAHFARHNRIWHDWLCQTIVWWNRMREVDGDEWMNGFERYDRMISPQAEEEPIAAWTLFQDRCHRLIQELKDAALA